MIYPYQLLPFTYSSYCRSVNGSSSSSSSMSLQGNDVLSQQCDIFMSLTSLTILDFYECFDDDISVLSCLSRLPLLSITTGDKEDWDISDLKLFFPWITSLKPLKIDNEMSYSRYGCLLVFERS